MRLYCSTPEKFPLRLVDVTELFHRELRARGVEQTWFCRGGSEGGRLRKEYVRGIELIVPPTLPSRGAWSRIVNELAYLGMETLCLLRQIGKRPDGILIRDKYWASFVGFAVSRVCGCKFVVWSSYPFPEHDLEEAGNTTGLKRLFKLARAAVGRTLLYRFAMRRADHCFVQSEQMKRDLLHWGVASERMTPVPMGISRSAFDAIRPDGTVATPPTVLYLGTLARVRQLQILVEAFEKVHRHRPDVRFKFVGDGDVPAERTALEDHARALGLSDVVTFTGQLPMDEAWTHVSAASVCLSPFRVTPVLRVASPTKLIEYLAFAKPTVVNRHPEHDLVVEHSKGALTVDWTPDAFAEAILWCLDHPAQAREMGLRGRAWVQSNRTYDRIADLVHRKLVLILKGKDAAGASM